MPLLVTNRLESWEKRCGIQESSAMLANTRGPSRNPVCAATNNNAASETRQRITNDVPNDHDPIVQAPKRFPNSTAFIVLPVTGMEFVSIYPNRMPPAVKAS